MLLLTPMLQCGFFSGILLLIAFGVATDYSVRLLIDLGVMLCRHRGVSFTSHTVAAAASCSLVQRSLREGALMHMHCLIPPSPPQ